jgi:hypothetical protein
VVGNHFWLFLIILSFGTSLFSWLIFNYLSLRCFLRLKTKYFGLKKNVHLCEGHGP